jgi:hypothetical protein
MPVFGRRPGCPDPLPFDTVHRSPDVRGHCGPRVGEPTFVSQLSARSVGCPTPLRSGVAPGFPAAVPPRRRCPANRTPLPESRPGLPASRLRRLSTPFTLTRFPVPSDDDAAEPRRREQLGCSFGLGPVTLCPWLPVARLLGTQSEWLLAPSGPASASWTEPVIGLGSPGGVRRSTRSPGPGWRALPGTRDTLADEKYQVKRYFCIPRVIPRTFRQSPGIVSSSTCCAHVRAQLCPQRTSRDGRRTVARRSSFDVRLRERLNRGR